MTQPAPDTVSLARPIYAHWAGGDPARRARAFELQRSLDGADHSRRRNSERLQVPLPETLVVGLTSACTLRCPGCAAAADFAHAPDALPPSLLDDVFQQCRELGIRRFALVGGEPLLRGEEVVRLVGGHLDCLFLLFTNGRQLDEQLASALAAHGNALLFLNIGASDPRSAGAPLAALSGTLERIARHGLPFAFAATVTRHNLAFLSASTTLELLGQAGAAGGLLFDCLQDFDEPASANAAAISADERRFFIDRARQWASSRGLLLFAVPEDEGLLGGCGAAGKALLHLSAYGTYDPCPFVPYSKFHAGQHALLDVLRSPYFEELRRATASPAPRGCTYRELEPLVRQVNARHGARRNSELL